MVLQVVIEKGKEIESLKAELESLQERYKIELEQSRMEFQKTKEGIVSTYITSHGYFYINVISQS